MGIRYRHAGSSYTSEFGIDWRALNGSFLGSIDYFGNIVHAKTALNINGCNNTTIGPIRISDARASGIGTISITSSTNVTLNLQLLNSSALVANSYAIAFFGNNQDIKIYGGTINNFDVCFRKQSGTQTRVQFNDITLGTFTTETNFTNAEYNKITAFKSFGHMTLSANSTATTISSIGTYTKIAGTTTVGSLNTNFTHTSGRLTYTGSPITRTFKITLIFTATSASSVHTGVKLNITGTNTNTTSYCQLGTNPISQQLIYIVSLTNNLPTLQDYVEVFITNLTNTTSITVTDLTLTIEQIN
jgi:hypothetical protein